MQQVDLSLPPFIRDFYYFSSQLGESATTHLDFNVTLGQCDQANISFVTTHTSDSSKAADFRKSAKLGNDDAALVFSFVVQDSVDSFALGELSGSIENLMGVGLGTLVRDIKISTIVATEGPGKVDTEGSGERIYCLIMSIPNASEHNIFVNRLQINDGYLGELSLSHRIGESSGQDLRAKLIVNMDISRAYLRGLSIPISPLALALSTITLGIGFEDMAAIKKAFPGMLDNIDFTSLELLTKELNMYIAAALKVEDTPVPVKELFYSFQESLKGFREVNLYAGDHTFSIKCEGIDFDKIFLSKNELLALEIDETALSAGILSRLNIQNPWVTKNKECRVLFIGLDAGGKTTMLYKLKRGGGQGVTIPTIGFNVEFVEYNDVKITIWDVGGQPRIRPLFRHYLPNTDVLVYIVDSNDGERIEEAKDELDKILNNTDAAGVPLLVIANKQDLPDAMSVSEITEKLGLHSLAGRQWFIQAACATTGEGLYEGLDWIVKVFEGK